jgi:hypothetical protein
LTTRLELANLGDRADAQMVAQGNDMTDFQLRI